MKRFLLIFSAMLFSIPFALLFDASSVSAASMYDSTLKHVDKLELISPNADKTKDISTSFIQQLRETCPANLQSQIDSFLDSEYYAISQYNSDYPLNEGGKQSQINFVYLNKNSSKNPNVTWRDLGYNNNSDMIVNTDGGFRLYMDNNENISCDGAVNPVLSTTESGNGSYKYTLKLFLSTYIPNYPDEYEGEQIKDTFEPEDSTRAHFGYTYQPPDFKTIDVVYLDNLPEFKDIGPTTANNYKWAYKIYETENNNEYNRGILIHQESLNLKFPFRYKFQELGQYILTIDFTLTPPAAPRDDIKQVTFLLNVNGYSQTSSTYRDECLHDETTGRTVCGLPEINCAALFPDNFIQQVNCEMDKMFNRGLINPSLAAFRNLFQSFVIAQPACSATLPNFTFIGRTFPSSTYIPKSCQTVDQFKAAFPFFTIAINFAWALMCLWLIARIINRLTDNNKNDIVEGI